MKSKYIIFDCLFVLIMSSILSSCEDDLFQEIKGEKGDIKVQITATTSFSEIESRAIFNEEINDHIEIKNYCFLLFDQNKWLIRAFNIAPESLPYYIYLPMPNSDTGAYHAILLGNVSLEQMFNPGLESGKYSNVNDNYNPTTISDLYGHININHIKELSTQILRTDNIPKDSTKFTWSGYLKVTQETQIMNFKLNPNMAKITAKITNNSAESKVMGVRLKNVAKNVVYAQNALNKSGNFVAEKNGQNEEQYLEYDMETLEIATGESQTISWYVPQNKQGDGNRTNAAPKYATYIEIDGVKMPNYITSAYKVYPGVNDNNVSYENLTDFNIKADTIYNLDVTITDDGISSDVSNGYKPDNDLASAKVKLPPNSNCYMIHPLGDKISGVTVYELPIDRINEFWRDIKNNVDKSLAPDSEWQMEVIWQDIKNRSIHFCDAYGNYSTTNGASDIYHGNGLNPVYFTLDPGTMAVTGNVHEDIYGNVLVGVKKIVDGVVQDGYLWSWHLWITDYNPDMAPAFSSSNKLYATNATSGKSIDLQGAVYATPSTDYFADTKNVTLNYNGDVSYDGNVQHYHSEYFSLWNNSTSSVLWDNGAYSDKWIMDRNLGSQASNVAQIQYPLESWGMYYQFGRKDPFSYRPTYDINGNARSYTDKNGIDWAFTENLGDNQWATAGDGTIENGIIDPNTYFVKNGEWAVDATDNDWYSPTSTSENDEIKTIFDPCPPGWKLPRRDVFDFCNDDELKMLELGDLDLKYNNGLSPTQSASHSVVNKCYSDISTNTTAHSPITVYVDVDGPYDSSTNYDNRAIKTYNMSLRSYRDPYRLYAILFSSRGSTTLTSLFPFQGNISGEDGKITKLLSENQSPVRGTTAGFVWADYYCYTAQACLWTVEKAEVATGGNMISMFTTTYENTVNARQERIRGRLYLRFHGMMKFRDYLTSRGQNVRCIQE